MRPNDGKSGRCGIRVSGEHWCVFDYQHAGEHSTKDSDWPPVAPPPASPEPLKLGIRDFPASEYLFPRNEPASPELMPEGWVNLGEVWSNRDGTCEVPLSQIQSVLAAQGLHIVPVSDAPKPAISWDKLRDDPCSNCGGYSRISTAGCDHCDHEEK